MKKEKKLVNLFKKKFKLCYCYEYSREFRAKHIRHSFLQHLKSKQEEAEKKLKNYY